MSIHPADKAPLLRFGAAQGLNLDNNQEVGLFPTLCSWPTSVMACTVGRSMYGGAARQLVPDSIAHKVRGAPSDSFAG